MTTAGHLIVKCLRAQGVERVFCVPGESYLDVLDGLVGSGIDVVNARHEGGAAMMAEADGKMTGRPGIAMVTRGPGATNAASGVHVAAQDSTPMILFVGQIGRDMRGREAFQEVDYKALFGGMAKWVEEIDRPERIPEILSHAWHIALSGRPGPVVIALPEDMLRETVVAKPGPKVIASEPAPAPQDIARLRDLLGAAQKPFLILGGSRWSEAAKDGVTGFAERLGLPVGCTFRRQDLFAQTHPNYAGDIGLGANPKLIEALKDADLLILLGGRFSEIPSQGFTLLGMPEPGPKLVHIHPGAEELGRIYAPTLAINATPQRFLEASLTLAGTRKTETHDLHNSYLEWSETPAKGVGSVTMSHTIKVLRGTLPPDAIMTNGAGNYATWLHRYWRYGRGSQLSPTSGSMGYGLPAAISAALRYPDREIYCLAGDGCFQMTGMEFGLAAERNLPVRVLVCDNSIYGTIRMHQERAYPGRVSATNLTNPDFAAWARSYGAVGLSVEKDADFAATLSKARSHKGPALIHLKLDARDIAPGRTL